MWFVMRVSIFIFLILVPSLSLQWWRHKRQISGNILEVSSSEKRISPALHRGRRQIPAVGGCEIPEPPYHGSFRTSHRSCPNKNSSLACRLVPGAFTPAYWILHFDCNYGYIASTHVSSTVCVNGRWIPALPTCNSPSDFCVLPDPLQYGSYRTSYRRCPPEDSSPACKLVPGTSVPPDWVIHFTCNDGFSLNINNTFSTCIKGQWHPKLPTCLESGICKTPKGVSGQCIDIKSCPLLLEMLLQQKEPGWDDYLRKSQCGIKIGKVHKVCCPDPLPDLSVCGLRSSERVSRVVNGHTASLGDWPWMAALGYNTSDNTFGWYCGGALISNKHVLTAATCVQNTGNNKLTVVRLGDLNLDDNIADGATPTDYSVEKTITHENYNISVETDNIALVILKDTVEFTKLIRPICIPSQRTFSADLAENEAFITGWGFTNYKRPRGGTLQEARPVITDQDTCKEAYKHFREGTIDDRLVCTRFDVGADTCSGDSGGPLMLSKKTNFYLIGVVSYGYGCAEPGFISINTKVSLYIDWIRKNMML